VIRIITFGSLKIWLFIQQLHIYKKDDSKSITEVPEYLCYFKFSEPTVIVYGELMCDKDGAPPKLFGSIEEAEQFAFDYLQKRFHLKK
jgi:hypothetical protein